MSQVQTHLTLSKILSNPSPSPITNTSSGTDSSTNSHHIPTIPPPELELSFVITKIGTPDHPEVDIYLFSIHLPGTTPAPDLREYLRLSPHPTGQEWVWIIRDVVGYASEDEDEDEGKGGGEGDGDGDGSMEDGERVIYRFSEVVFVDVDHVERGGGRGRGTGPMAMARVEVPFVGGFGDGELGLGLCWYIRRDDRR